MFHGKKGPNEHASGPPSRSEVMDVHLGGDIGSGREMCLLGPPLGFERQAGRKLSLLVYGGEEKIIRNCGSVAPAEEGTRSQKVRGKGRTKKKDST